MNTSWLDWRRQGLGSSDAAAIMGVSPWKTPYQTWEDKVLGSQSEDNSAMKRGRDMEETARQEFERVVGTLVAPSNVVHNRLDWMRASLDGIDISKTIMVEIKCPGKEDHALACQKKIPEKYWPQVQHQLEVAGLDGMYYFSFDGLKGVVVEVKRDQGYIDTLLEKEAEFWAMVLSKKPPELTERDYLSMEGNSQWQNLSKELLHLRLKKKALEDKDKETMEKLKSLAQGRSAKGYGLVLQKQICAGAVDYSKVPELQGVNLEIYRKSSFEKWVPRAI